MDCREVLDYRGAPLFGASRYRMINRREAGFGVSWPINARGMFFDDGEQSFWAVRGICSTGFVNVGEVVALDQTVNGQWFTCPIAGNEREMPAGVIVSSQFTPQWTWIAITGIVYVLPEAALTPTMGAYVFSSVTTAGRVQEAAALPAAVGDRAGHVGQWTQAGTGPGALTLCKLQLN